MPIQMQPVSSSYLRAVGWDEDRGVLRIEFQDGKTYDYHGVPKSVYEGLLSAPSAGKFFHAHGQLRAYQKEQV